MSADPKAEIDRRFSDPDAAATPWSEALAVLDRAELYWISTVRSDGRPHVTPLIGVVEGEAVHFCTGLGEQKARNLEHNGHVALTTGENTWASGLDVVVEGSAVRVTDRDALQRLADAYEAKYGTVWHFDVGDGVFLHSGDSEAAVFRVEAAKVMAFAKDPHAQTRYLLGG
jgi:nitroimidazol reductase NimA-like FMN-containing flavoprotein (pyridoxamine 5'-phosphate oxidase superfamily)